MRWFTYHGDREETQLFGLRFLRGVPTEIPQDFDSRFLAKLQGNREFSEAFDGYTISGNTVDVQETELAEKPETVSGSADTEQESDELEALRQEADSIGLKVDLRWKAARLKREIEAAKG